MLTDRSARLSLGFSCVGHSFSHVLTLLYPTVVLVLEHEWGMPYDQLLALALAGSVLFGVGALPAGWLGDRWSAAGMMVVFFLGSGASAIYTGLANTPFELGLGLALTGLFASIYHPVGIAWLVQNAKNRGKALGLNGVFGSLGVGLASLLAGALADLISWRAAFIVPGVVCFAIGLAMMLLVRGGTMMRSKADITPEADASRADMWRAFIILSVTMAAAGLIYQCTSLALPKLFEERSHGLLGHGAMGVGAVVSVIYLLSGACQLLGGHLADRYPLRMVYIATFALQAPLFLIAADLGGAAIAGTAALLVVTQTLGIPAESSLLARYSPAKWRSTAFGAKFVLSIGVSAAGVPLVSFIYAFTGGFDWLFATMAGLAGVAVAAALMLPRDGSASDRGVPASIGRPAEAD